MTDDRVLAIDPYSRGMGYVVVENGTLLVDWGTTEARDEKNGRCLERLAELHRTYRPDVLVLEDPEGEGSRRCERIIKLLDDAAELAESRAVDVRRYSRGEIRTAFRAWGAKTKHEIASAVAQRFPPLAPELPEPRAVFESEAERMAVFDAGSLAVSFLSDAARKHGPLA